MKYYKVKVIKSTFPNQYHVICTNNNVTHSAWTTCDECNPVIEDDVICQRCGEHSEMREETGTECCGAGSRF